LNWLGFLADYQLGGILADDMGLGKTLQTLAHLLSQKQRGKLTLAALVVAPTSLLSNWQREAKRFTPGLKVHVYHGPQRHEQRRHYIDTKTQKLNCDLIITSYPLLARDKAFWSKQQFHSVILDEAQYIKNPGAQVAQVARSLHCAHRLCLTGTPMENHLGELWSLFQFLMPDFLGSQSRFNVVYRKPIENEGDIERQKHLNQRITPFMLRRTKHEVAQELPPKTEIIHTVTLPEKQARLYETIRVAMEKKVLTLLKSKGMASSQIEMLDALLKLRQVCCDPRLLKMESAQKVQHSAKLELLMELVPELLEEGRRILIFSQFTSMLGLIEAELKDRSIAYSKLTGQTRKRDEAISQFQDGHVPVFLISLKAGGVGLNLTEADTVIHYDPWWNPAAEQQATDRAYRIGQDKPVFVYKLICESTVEERILSLQKKKQDLADAMYEQGEQEQGGSNLSRLGGEELLALFSPL
jgi:SNF2 family DNA or RNA helicase